MTVDAKAVISVQIPQDALVGDEFTIAGTARITGISEDMIDVRAHWESFNVLPGERNYTIPVHVDRLDLKP